MKTKMVETILVILGFLFVLSIPASAQWKDNMGGSWNNPTSASIGNIINDQLWNRVFAKARARDKARAAASTKPGGVQTPPAVPEATKKTPAQIDTAVRFRSTGTQIRTQAFADFLSAGGTPETKQQMVAIINTLLTEYEKAARAQGKPNDLALAVTAALVYNGSIYKGTPEPDDTRIMEIRDALAELALEDGTFATMTDRQKQELYENLVICTMLAKVGYEDAKKTGDQATMASYRGLAGQTLTAVSGMPPEKINFGPQTVARGETNPSSPPTIPQNAVVQTISATTLVMEFERNEVRATQMYGGKRIRVNGTVNQIEVQENGIITLTFVSPAASPAKTRCYFNKSQSSRLANIIGGKEASVEGIVRGFGSFGKFYVVMEDCTVP